jgi:hypothetical protein
MRPRLAVSMRRAATVRSLARKVVSAALASGCSFGTALRTVSISQEAAVRRIKRTGLASGERQLVRSEASGLL